VPVRRPQVIAAAVELLDEVGLEGLTTRALAQRLGVRAGALYWHVESKQALLDAITDRIAAELVAEEPPTGTWQERLASYAHRLRRVMLAHRDGARLISAGPSALSRHALAYADQVMGVLRSGGASLPTAASGADTMFSYVTGFALQEQAMSQLAVDEQAMAEFIGSLDMAALPNFAEWAPQLRIARQEPFEAGLAIIVSGLAAQIAAEVTAGPARA
jgi:TetR/AcrR family tetracycline transcriptional repressor